MQMFVIGRGRNIGDGVRSPTILYNMRPVHFPAQWVEMDNIGRVMLVRDCSPEESSCTILLYRRGYVEA
jgi:hypothetical protein